MRKSHLWHVTMCLTVLLAVGPFSPVGAQNNGSQQGGVGKFGDLTAQWWQWVTAQPAVDVGGTNTNPSIDSTGAYASVGQENGIGPGNNFFFLAGAFGGVVTRTVTVPQGKALFFPVINTEKDNANDPPTHYKVPELRAQATAGMDLVTSTDAKLNGVRLEIFRRQTPVFDYTVPDQDGIYEYFGLIGPQFRGRIKPAVGDGYWVYIAPLPPGGYTLEFAAADSSGFSLHVKYLLTIE